MYDLGGIDNVDGGASGFPGGFGDFNFGSAGMNIDPNSIFNMFFSENMDRESGPSFFQGFSKKNKGERKRNNLFE